MIEKISGSPLSANHLAKMISDVETGHQIDGNVKELPGQAKMGKLGGNIGGKARAASLSPERRREIAKHAARNRRGGDE